MWCVCVCVCVCVLISNPLPCIYRREPRGETLATDLRRRHMSRLRCWGPRAWSADQCGRPTAQGRQPPPVYCSSLSWASLSAPRWSRPFLTCLSWVLGLHSVHLSLNWCSDIFCDFMSGQSVLATYILAQKHILYFLEGEVWFRDLFG